ncbi:MAG: hypothetical protein EXR05_09670 [Acetobacteraceae bacterium]|nr:hypothetical protein [Acetobacteraceae bacterium]MSP29085.1 hypothetical protein [Acetobacteraceae bacterium]
MQLSRLTLGAAFTAGLAFTQLALPASAKAADVNIMVRNAGELAVLCAAKLPDPHHAAKENFCHGFAQGVFSAELERARTAGAGAARIFCLSSSSPNRTTTLNDFVKWIDANPVHKSEPAVATLTKFLSERLPCRNGATAPAAAPATPAPAR